MKVKQERKKKKQITLIKYEVFCKGLVLSTVGHVETHADFPTEIQKCRVLRFLSLHRDSPELPKSAFWCHQISDVVIWHVANLHCLKKWPGCWATSGTAQGVRQWEPAPCSCCGSPWPWGYAACGGCPGLETQVGNRSCCAQPVWTPVLLTRE